MNRTEPLVAGISVVIPVLNSEDGLEELVTQLEAVLREFASPFEVILVNDGSQDSSWERISTLAARRQWLHGINLMRNYGQHNALLCGIRAARYETTVTMDDDLQNPPEEIPRLVDALTPEVDVVYGTPPRPEHGAWRNLASFATKWALQTIMGAETARKVSAFRALRTRLRMAFETYQSPSVSIDVLLTWGTSRFASVPVKHVARKVGRSNYSVTKLVVHAFNMVTGFSVLPLRIVSVLGLILTVFGLAVLLYVMFRFLIEGGSVPGFPFLASMIAIFSGAQLFALGVIGEYLGRIHFRTMDRPAYSIAEFVRTDQPVDPENQNQP